MESKRFSLNKEDLKSIGIGALIAISGALLTYLSEVILKVDFGSFTPVVYAITPILINALRKWLSEVK